MRFRQKIQKMLRSLICAIVSGILLGVSFPYISIWPAAYLFLVPLLYIAEKEDAKTAFFTALLSGFVGYSMILYWICPTVYWNTGSVFQSLLALSALSLYVSLYLAVFLVLYKLLVRPTAVGCFYAAALWVSLEYARSGLLTGFPWALLGYSQWNNLAAVQVSAFSGVYGTSFLVVLANLTIFRLIRKTPLKNLTPAIVAIVLILAMGYAEIQGVSDEYRSRHLDMAVIQPNIDQYKKWDSTYYGEITRKISDCVVTAAYLWKPELIVWPETSVADMNRGIGEGGWVETAVKTSMAYNLVGALWDEKGLVYNSSILINPDGKIENIHKKTHLVPFGEFVPFRMLLEPYVSVFNEIGDITRGTVQTVMTIKGVSFGPMICSENLFPDIARKFARNGAEVLVVLTNDAWYKKTAAPFQHFIFNVFRAVENKRYVVQSANTGVSGVVSPDGKILKATAVCKEELFDFRVYPVQEMTFYTRFGDVFALLCIISSVFLLVGNAIKYFACFR